MAMVNFKKGLRAGLPATYAEGTFYVTTDERAIYLDVSDSARIRLGDFQEFASVAALEANANPSTTALYFVSDINCLAKWDGSQYVQINRDTGATSFEVTGEGNAVTAVAYDATGRKLTLTKGATYMTAADVDGKISAATGSMVHNGTTYTTVAEFVNAKTAGIATDAALGDLQTRVATAEGDIDKLEAALGAEGETGKAVAAAQSAAEAAQSAADTAQAAADAAQADVDALEGKVGTVEDGKTVVGLIGEAKTQADKGVEDAAAAQAAADKAQEEVDALELVVGTPAEGKTIVQMIEDAQTAATYDDTQVKADIKANADAIDAIEEDYLKAADKTELANAVNAEKERAEGIEGGLRTDVDAIKGDYLKAADKEELQGNIDTVSGAVERLTNGVSADEVDGVNDLIQYVKDHGAEVTGMQEGIADNAGAIADLEGIVGKEAEGENPATGLVKGVADNAAAIAAEKLRAEGEEAKLAQADATNLQAAKDYADGKVADLGIADYVKKADADATYAVIGHNHDDKYDAKGDAAKALEDAKTYVDGKDSAMNTRVEALEAIDHEHANKALLDTYTQTEENLADAVAKKHEHANAAELAKVADGDVAKWNAAQANAEATAAAALATAKSDLEGKINLKANSDDVYAKTETFTKDEVNALLTWGSF